MHLLPGILLASAVSLHPTAVVSTVSFPVAQATLTPEQALDRLFSAPEAEARWFTETFLNQVPISQINAILANLETSLGAYQTVQPPVQASDSYFIVFEQGRVPTQITLDETGRIATLLLQPPQSNAVPLETAIAQLQEFPGVTSLLVLKNGETQAALNADNPLAVGSAFKLAVLAALQQQIEAGDRHWNEVVALQPEWKSLPSGILQTWPDGALLTLETLATLMISQSDNTATDGLIDVLGRSAVEAFSPRDRPFLTTREFFILKAPQNAPLLARYQAGSESERRQLLTELESLPLPQPQELNPNPVALDVEWLMSTRELCELMSQVADLPLMGVNPGVANPANWSQVAYKGGSESGVLNLTTQLTAADGTTYCVATTWNNPDAALDELRLITLYGGILAGLHSAAPDAP